MFNVIYRNYASCMNWDLPSSLFTDAKEPYKVFENQKPNQRKRRKQQRKKK